MEFHVDAVILNSHIHTIFFSQIYKSDLQTEIRPGHKEFWIICNRRYNSWNDSILGILQQYLVVFFLQQNGWSPPEVLLILRFILDIQNWTLSRKNIDFDSYSVYFHLSKSNIYFNNKILYFKNIHVSISIWFLHNFYS